MAEFMSSGIILEILSRMPMKSLARFRCVSKQWCNYIDDPYLETMHAKRGSHDQMLIMLNQFPSTHPNTLCTVMDYKHEEGARTVDVRKKPPVMDFMCSRRSSEYPSNIILGSCNGLLYSSQEDHHGCNTLVVINPLMKESYELPPIKKNHSIQSWLGLNMDLFEESNGLGFDESTNTFKMVSVVIRNVPRDQFKEDVCTMVHVLGTNSWRKIPQVPAYRLTGEGVFSNGCVHWLIGHKVRNERDTYFGRPIIRFDVVKEEFALINPPQETPSVWGWGELVDLHGEVGYTYYLFGLRVEVWVLKERGWMLHCKFPRKLPLPDRGFIRVLGFWNKAGDILMTVDRKHMFVYNLRSHSLNKVNLVGWKEGPTIDIRVYQGSLFSSRYSMKTSKKTGSLSCCLLGSS